MKHLVVETSFGPLFLVGRLYAERKRPALVAVGGAWAADDFLHELVDWFPGATVLVSPLPGMGGSVTRSWDVSAMSRAVDEAIALFLREVPVVAFGASTGCLVTLGLRAPEVVRQVALEPFFRTAPLWPVHEFARRNLAGGAENAGFAAAAEGLFGFTQESVTDRDHRKLLAGLETPADVILGDVPLEPLRRLDAWPSLTSVEDRAELARHPLITLHRGPAGSGHYVHGTPEGAATMRQVLTKALTAAIADAGAALRPA